MEVTKGEDRSAEQAASLFGTPELESQRTNPERGKKKNNHCKIITGVLLLCLLVVILAVVLSLRKSSDGKADGELWLQEAYEELLLPQCPPGFFRPPVILVSLDGFRAPYLKDHSSHLPIINKLRKLGTTTPHMRPVYPTKTFPNHYSIVTGLYPESHGIVDNKMYDVSQNTFFSLKSNEKFNAKWYQGEPVWITAMRQKLKVGTFFWPGSDVRINGTFPDLYQPYDMSISFEQRVATLFEWLSLPQGERPDFYTLYLDEPDSSGHRYGPASNEVVQALKNVDRILGMLMDGLTQTGLHHCVNIIITSDHGMEEASCKNATFVSTYLNKTDGFAVIQGPAARIRPRHLPEDFFSFDYEGLMKNLSCRTPDQSMRPYLKENLPKRMHFANNKRIERGHLYMKEGWQAALNSQELKYCNGGFHGSDNLFTNMQAIFIGYGPAFKENTVVPLFENIEIYNLICDLLSIRPAPNNGTHGSLNHLLKHPVHLPVHPAQLSHDTPCEASELIPVNDLQCTCTSQTKAMEANMNRDLLLTKNSVKASLRRLHHPFGYPRVIQPGATFCLLHQSNYLNGYSKDRLMPLWVSYTLQPLTGVQPLSAESEECVRADARIPPAASQLCLRYRNNPTLSFGLLHPPNLSAEGAETDSLITSNMAPMFPAFKDVWTHIHDVLLPKYSQQLNGVNVMSGPIFDEDYDGNVDALKAISGNEAPIPTHFYVILTSCGNSTFSPVNCEGALRAKSFILPHRPDHSESCADGSDLEWVKDWLLFHTARVRDIELLAGLSFYHDRLSVEETLQLKTFLETA
ncbi:ectonucleotide pyrophosphatase/phosphodiesterase family member 1 isoform X1 [Etheostoma spectabile]|uniref:ectonucleotide pyrophosphatase/phosphodiesterase family member 1 isoform X1 n=1 Tax=Etheostoma spectabile TaxID=54343 RepID=UPI0013AFA7AC|nr:ectonucleotide pyrophosphatase/phosphodiesterase family member 1-like isoform X1 [Etheostoma spectabile]